MSMTTEELHAHMASETDLAQALFKKGNVTSWDGIGRAVKALRRIAVPIALERDRAVAENEILRQRLTSIEDAAYEVTKAYDDGPECHPAWFEGYGLPELCKAIWSHLQTEKPYS